MIQRRVDGSVDFYRDYSSYKKGFGILHHEFWLGNEKIFHLTNQNNYTLRIDMVIEGGILAFAEYDAFRINDKTDDFRLASLGSFTGSGRHINPLNTQQNLHFIIIRHSFVHD